MHFILFYEVADDYLARRQEFRKSHLELVEKSYQHGELLLAGALANPVDGAVLIFRGSAEVASNFAKSDPYVLNGLVTNWQVREWSTVIGDNIPPISTM